MMGIKYRIKCKVSAIKLLTRHSPTSIYLGREEYFEAKEDMPELMRFDPKTGVGVLMGMTMYVVNEDSHLGISMTNN